MTTDPRGATGGDDPAACGHAFRVRNERLLGVSPKRVTPTLLGSLLRAVPRLGCGDPVTASLPRWFLGWTWRSAVAVGCLFLLAGCASTQLTLPRGPSVPLVDYQPVFEEATISCRQVRTLQAAMAVNARSGERRLRGDVLAALARPASLRLVGVAAFGAPGFVLVAEPASSTLVLPRDRRVITGATANELLDVVAGLSLDAEEFRAVVTGCLVPDPRAVDARIHENGWIAVRLEDEATAYVHTLDDAPVVVAGTRPGMTVWYSGHVRGLPRKVDVRAVDSQGLVTELTATLSQVSINIDLGREVFVAQIRDDYVPMTLEQFRESAGPLESGSVDPSRPQ